MVFPRGTNQVWKLDPRGNGTLDLVGTFPDMLKFDKAAPSAMYDNHKVLLIRGVQNASIVDIRNPNKPVSQVTGSLREPRHWANTIALPNGEVLLVGGASILQKEDTAIKYVEIWSPTTGRWRTGASAAKSRLYHSAAILLPDATVLVGGGGPPGQKINQNAELYMSSGLFDEKGKYSVRPVITSLENDVLNYGQKIQVGFSNATTIERVTLIRLGSVTHSFNMDERMRRLHFKQNHDPLSLVIKIPTSRSATPPGYYMLFILNDMGVPSVAKIVNLRA